MAAVPGLYLLDNIDPMGIPEWLETVRDSAEPVMTPCGRVGKNPRYRLDYGKKYLTRGTLADAPDIPPVLAEFLQYCHDTISAVCGIYDLPDWPPDQCLVNIYAAGQKIAAHVDHPKHFGGVIFCATFGGRRTMRFTRLGVSHDVVTPPNSLYVMSEAARYDWTHEMLPSDEDCFSITTRYLK